MYLLLLVQWLKNLQMRTAFMGKSGGGGGGAKVVNAADRTDNFFPQKCPSLHTEDWSCSPK